VGSDGVCICWDSEVRRPVCVGASGWKVPSFAAKIFSLSTYCISNFTNFILSVIFEKILLQ
jgi:hypothetical protein